MSGDSGSGKPMLREKAGGGTVSEGAGSTVAGRGGRSRAAGGGAVAVGSRGSGSGRLLLREKAGRGTVSEGAGSTVAGGGGSRAAGGGVAALGRGGMAAGRGMTARRGVTACRGGMGGDAKDVMVSGSAGEDGTGATATTDWQGPVKDRAFCSAMPWQALRSAIKDQMIGLTEYLCPKVHHRSLYCFKTGTIECGPLLRH
jgi:hypothetical protein